MRTLTSDVKTSTMVIKLPTDVTMGPHMPNKTCETTDSSQRFTFIRDEHSKKHTINPELNIVPLSAMPAIHITVHLSLGSRKISIPVRSQMSKNTQRKIPVVSPMRVVNKFGNKAKGRRLIVRENSCSISLSSSPDIPEYMLLSFFLESFGRVTYILYKT